MATSPTRHALPTYPFRSTRAPASSVWLLRRPSPCKSFGHLVLAWLMGARLDTTRALPRPFYLLLRPTRPLGFVSAARALAAPAASANHVYVLRRSNLICSLLAGTRPPTAERGVVWRALIRWPSGRRSRQSRAVVLGRGPRRASCSRAAAMACNRILAGDMSGCAAPAQQLNPQATELRPVRATIILP